MALFWAVPAMLARGPWTFALGLLAFEALRGHLFTGFPWAMAGHIWIDTPLAQVAALSGALGLSALTFAMAALLARMARGLARGQTLKAGALALVAVALGAGGWGLGALRLAEPEGGRQGIRLRLVQPNALQHLKWDRDFAEYYFFRHLDLSAQEPADGRAPDVVIWSETAVPFFLENPGAGLVMAADAAGGVPLVLGIQRRDDQGRFFNSLAVLDDTGAPVAVHDKHHLVPFGEYVPLIGAWAAARGVGGLAAQALTGYTPGPGPALVDLGPLGRVLPLICYEAVFPRNLRGTERPDWLLQLTNDAWFGAWSGPFQHLAQARLRAIEQGLPLVRAANTGVSAVIDARGRVVAELGLDRAGVLDADLPAARPATPYARWGDGPWHASLALALAGLVALAWRRRLQGGRNSG
jgi:apolipoprotein N-acyltransferase